MRQLVSRFSAHLPKVLWPVVVLSVVSVTPPGDLAAQGPASLLLRGPDGVVDSLSVDRSRGYATVTGEILEELGWAVETSPTGLQASVVSGGSVVEFAFGVPVFRWNGEVLQLVDVPYQEAGGVRVPLQFLIDFLPVRLSDSYAFLPDEGVLQVRDSAVWAGLTPDEPTTTPVQEVGPAQSVGQEALPDVVDAASVGLPEDASPIKRVVIIDPGHGGRDPGTSGAGGRREKDIALAVGRALARELAGDEDLEVFVTRDRDVLIPIWERGELATEWKGDRPGIFVSIHANALPNRGSVRGFETLFLSDARTEHERRVAANENAPLLIDREDAGVDGEEEDLGFILRELRNLDHSHWSSLLAEGVQRQLETIHPGPNRGVKQAPLAVLTNALMPAVLVEVGFVTNREEERLLSQGEFQGHLAQAMARAIRDFFERYPPGQGETVTGLRP